jgi:hypothetical protein
MAKCQKQQHNNQPKQQQDEAPWSMAMAPWSVAMAMATVHGQHFRSNLCRAFMIVMIIVQTHSGAHDPSLSRDTWFKKIMSQIGVTVPMRQIFHMDLSPSSWNPFQ